MSDEFSDSKWSVRDDLIARVRVHAVSNFESVRSGLRVLGARTADELDERRLGLLLGWLDQPVFARDAL
jgi:hypothetical protein